jgi:hypothetical protein
MFVICFRRGEDGRQVRGGAAPGCGGGGGRTASSGWGAQGGAGRPFRLLHHDELAQCKLLDSSVKTQLETETFTIPTKTSNTLFCSVRSSQLEVRIGCLEFASI